MFKKYKKILNKKEKQKILNFVKTKVQYLGEGYPGLQSKDNLHSYKEMDIFIKKVQKFITPNNIKTCWANYSTGDTVAWHTHNCKYNIVYYLFNPSKLGVMFQKQNDSIEHTEGIENSLVIFDGSKIHSAPNSEKKINRYTIAMEII